MSVLLAFIIMVTKGSLHLLVILKSSHMIAQPHTNILTDTIQVRLGGKQILITNSQIK